MQELKSKKVISTNDIIVLKKYIEKKDTEHSVHEKANILADAVHQIIDKNTEGLNEKYRVMLRQNLLKDVLFKGNKTVFLSDIFDTCISFEDKPDDFIDNMVKWINLHIGSKIEKKDLKKYDNSDNEPDIICTPKEKVQNYTDIKPDNKSSILIKLANNFKLRKMQYASFIFIILIIFSQTVYAARKHFGVNHISQNKLVQKISYTLTSTKISKKKIMNSNLPFYLRYKDINIHKLKDFLDSKNSLLSEEPYFSAIISSAKEYDVNPLVLFAITGQEEDFVPKNTPSADKIANNPFNVYHSWREYNTNIKDSSEIASGTVVKLCKDKPSDKEPFYWINRKYAEDPNWWKGVKSFYEQLESIIK